MKLHGNAKDYTGQRFGRLIAIESTTRRRGGNVMWHCVCDCGEHTLVAQGNLVRGNTQSCGCLRHDALKAGLNYKHGRSGTKKYEQEAQRKLKYGLSPEDYDRMVATQDGKCAICGEQRAKLCVDHDHETGKVRGLLCKRCNLGLGTFGDNVAGLKRAIKYLEKQEVFDGAKKN